MILLVIAYPPDDALILSDRVKQRDMQKASASVAAEVPDNKAEEILGKLAGMYRIEHVLC